MKNRSGCTSLLTFIPMVTVGTVMLVLALRTDPTLMTDDGMMGLKTLYLTLAAVFLGGSFLLGLFLLLLSFGGRKRAQKLIKNGVQGSAKVLEIEDTGMFVNDQPRVYLKLEIKLPDTAPYTLEKEMVLPLTKLAQVSIGSQVQVLVDPADPDNPKNVGLLLA